MRHFRVEEWTDYARGVAAKPDAAAMREHLQTGCEKCTRMFDSLSKVVEAAGVESSTSPPAGAVRSARRLIVDESISADSDQLD